MAESAVVVGEKLKTKAATVACAESCTGGLVTSLLTDVPGSSGYVAGSVVCYTNEVKARIVGVARTTLDRYSAVSGETAGEMALGVRKLMGTDYGLATTGNLGPEPSEGRPVGLVYIAVASEAGVICEELHLQGSRSENKAAVAERALALLDRSL